MGIKNEVFHPFPFQQSQQYRRPSASIPIHDQNFQWFQHLKSLLPGINHGNQSQHSPHPQHPGLEVRCSDPVLNAQLYSNRAHVRLLLRQFVEAAPGAKRVVRRGHDAKILSPF